MTGVSLPSRLCRFPDNTLSESSESALVWSQQSITSTGFGIACDCIRFLMMLTFHWQAMMFKFSSTRSAVTTHRAHQLTKSFFPPPPFSPYPFGLFRFFFWPLGNESSSHHIGSNFIISPADSYHEVAGAFKIIMARMTRNRFITSSLNHFPNRSEERV